MKMTNAQAATYCNAQAVSSLTGKPSGEEASREWDRLRAEIETDGLETVERRLTTWLEQVQAERDPHRSANTSVADAFLAAVYDEDEIKRAIAGDLKEKVKLEIEKQSTYPLRALYLSYLRNHLGNVEDEAANLEDYEEARENIEEQLKRFELEYGKWITNALAAQEE